MIKEITAQELNEQLANGADCHLLDVRQMNEIAQGTIPGAEPLPLHLLPMSEERIPTDKPVVLVCRSGARSAQACYFLAQKGYENIMNLRGGVIDWARNGFDFERPQDLAISY